MQVNVDFEKEVLFLQNLITKGGPQFDEFEALDNWFYEIWDAHENGEISLEQIDQLRAVLGMVYDNPETMFGQVYTAPYGYKGDFEIIDRIYQTYVTNIKVLSNWDRYFQRTAATNAVRNRKEYFKNILATKASTNPNLKVLNLASGPCRDLKEFYEEYNHKQVEIDCVEFDPRAIKYAKKMLNPDQKVQFIQENVFKFSTEKKYDLIWSAGLFDYFDGEAFTKILHKILEFTTENGEIIIGNFDAENPTKNCMEFTKWSLFHRNENELLALARNAGVINNAAITIEKESEGINLFMRIKNIV